MQGKALRVFYLSCHKILELEEISSYLTENAALRKGLTNLIMYKMSIQGENEIRLGFFTYVHFFF